MKIVVAAVQMPSDLLDVSANLDRADDLLRSARDSSVELAVLPELFNTGYSLCPDFGPYSETAEGPTFVTSRTQPRVADRDCGWICRARRATSLRFARFLQSRR